MIKILVTINKLFHFLCFLKIRKNDFGNYFKKVYLKLKKDQSCNLLLVHIVPASMLYVN